MESSTILFGLEQIDNKKILDTSLISEEINRELEEYLLEKSKDSDSTDGEWLSNCTQDEFDKLIGEDTNKKRFIKALMHIFALLLNAKVGTADRIKKILKIAIKHDSENMARTKLTVCCQRRLPDWLTYTRLMRQRRTYPYKIKFNLPEQKKVDIRKNGDIIKTISVRCKSKYFNDWFARVF